MEPSEPYSPYAVHKTNRHILICHRAPERICAYFQLTRSFVTFESRPTHARKHWARATSTPMIYESLARWSLANTYECLIFRKFYEHCDTGMRLIFFSI